MPGLNTPKPTIHDATITERDDHWDLTWADGRQEQHLHAVSAVQAVRGRYWAGGRVDRNTPRPVITWRPITDTGRRLAAMLSR